MDRHGLLSAGWAFGFDRARRRFGCCNLTLRHITISAPLTLLNDVDEVRDTILHEIAHALTENAGHGPQWKAMCVKIGAKPERCYRDAEVISPPRAEAPYRIGCVQCGWWAPRRRRSDRKLLCAKCGKPVVIEPTPSRG